MKRTCFNCAYFYSTLSDANQDYHIHYWCRHWNAIINNTCGIADQYEYTDCYYDDLETGDAMCYMFKEKEKEMFPDEWFEKNKQENIKNRIIDTN